MWAAKARTQGISLRDATSVASITAIAKHLINCSGSYLV